MYEIKWSYGNAEPKRSTMFPDNWSRSKVIEKIYESLKNIVKSTKVSNKRWELEGTTNEGIVIRAIVDIIPLQSGQSIGKIITAHPVLEKALQ